MTHPLVKDHLALIATQVYSSCRLLEKIEPLEAPEDVRTQIRLLHVGLDLAYSAIEHPTINELIEGDDRPF
jgi:hypothetical protein